MPDPWGQPPRSLTPRAPPPRGAARPVFAGVMTPPSARLIGSSRAGNTVAVLAIAVACTLLTLCADAKPVRIASGQSTEWTSHGDDFDFIPEYKATLSLSGAHVVYNGRCWLAYDAVLYANDAGGEIVFNVKDHSGGLFCTDWFVFATREAIRFKGFTKSGTHHFSISGWKDGEWDDVQRNGIDVFLIGEGAVSALIDAWDAWRLFHGHRTAEQARQEIEAYMNFTYVARNPADVVWLDPASVHSGDVFAITRLDSTNMFIQIGTGSRVGHVALALWRQGELQVCEAVSDKHCDGQWPAPYGIICTPWARWMNLSLQVGYLVSYLPLAPSLRAQFNTSAALAFVEAVLGLPYGNHNFFYTWVDTPDANYPPPLSAAAVEVGAPVLERAARLPPSDPGSVYSMLVAGANQRLGTVCNDTACLYAALDARNLSLAAVLPLPEQDTYRYDGQRALVCSSFVLSVLREAGLFPGLDFQATEAQPRDIYLLQVYDSQWSKPAACAAQPGPDCQIMGAYVLDLPLVNTVPPHPQMFSACPTLPPLYERPESC